MTSLVISHSKHWALSGIAFLFLAPLVLSACCNRCYRWLNNSRGKEKPARLLFAGAPIRGLADVSNVLLSNGWNSSSVAVGHYKTTPDSIFDQVINLNSQRAITTLWKSVCMMLVRLHSTDIVHGYMDGALLRATPIKRFEFAIWRIAGVHIILFAYGRDSFDYRALPDRPWARALEQDYPLSDTESARIARLVAFNTRLAHRVVGCLVHTYCLPRVDVYPLLWYPADLSVSPNPPRTHETVRVAHASNHRAIKGTDSLIEAVENMQSDGIDISLDVIENVSHECAMKRLNQADIVVDQLLFGYALQATEGMVLGKVVITGVDLSDPLYAPYLDNPALTNSPLTMANENTVEATLRELIDVRETWQEMGNACRSFAEEIHGPEQSKNLFENLYLEFGYSVPRPESV